MSATPPFAILDSHPGGRGTGSFLSWVRRYAAMTFDIALVASHGGVPRTVSVSQDCVRESPHW